MITNHLIFLSLYNPYNTQEYIDLTWGNYIAFPFTSCLFKNKKSQCFVPFLDHVKQQSSPIVWTHNSGFKILDLQTVQSRLFLSGDI
jgi:hypothetical protein